MQWMLNHMNNFSLTVSLINYIQLDL